MERGDEAVEAGASMEELTTTKWGEGRRQSRMRAGRSGWICDAYDDDRKKDQADGMDRTGIEVVNCIARRSIARRSLAAPVVCAPALPQPISPSAFGPAPHRPPPVPRQLRRHLLPLAPPRWASALPAVDSDRLQARPPERLPRLGDGPAALHHLLERWRAREVDRPHRAALPRRLLDGRKPGVACVCVRIVGPELAKEHGYVAGPVRVVLGAPELG